MAARVLIAEDDPDVAKMLRALVRSWGGEPVVVHDGAKALAALVGEDAPTHALLDWMMPGLSGPEACREARARGSSARIVVLTARDRGDDVVEGLTAGADDYVVKPFDHAVLRARLFPTLRVAPQAETVAPGTVLAGRYRLEKRIGEGGMGSVYRATHVLLGHSVAVKLIRTDLLEHPVLRARFENEARMASMLRSPNVARVYDYGTTSGGLPFVVTEYVSGATLTRRVRENGAMPFASVVQLVRDVANGLGAAHDVGIVHRDVKPENVLLEDLVGGDEAAFCAKLIDFGLARLDDASDSRNSVDGAFIGTLGYASPEQLTSSRVDFRTDLWALGATAFFAAVGRPLVPDGSDVAMRALTSRGMIPAPSALRSGLPAAFDGWLRRACATHPQDRFADARSMAFALEALEAA